MLIRFFLIGFICTLTLEVITPSAKADTVTILSYQRIDEDRYPETNIRLEQFRAHIEELVKNNIPVISAETLLSFLEGNASLPKRSVLITFDGGYRSAYEKALPILDEAKLPYLFNFAPGSLKRKHGPYINQAMLRNLSRNSNATLGIHTHGYERLDDMQAQTLRHAINHAKADYKKMLGKDAEIFAYPFGELSKEYINIVRDSGFNLGFALHSQPISTKNLEKQNFRYALPRFAMTENYADIDRLRMILNLDALPISDITPSDLRLDNDKPIFGFTVEKDKLFPEQLQCFLSDRGQVDLTFITQKRIQIKLDSDLQAGRIRLNCMYFEAVKGQTEPQWYWFGRLFTLPQAALQPLPE